MTMAGRTSSWASTAAPCAFRSGAVSAAGGSSSSWLCEGVESHLGARTVDLDGDGDREIVSIGWDAPQAIHVLRNDANVAIGTGRPGRYPKMRSRPTIGVAISRRE